MVLIIPLIVFELPPLPGLDRSPQPAWADGPGTSLVSIGDAEEFPNGTGEFGSISSDGRYVAFESAASNLVAGDTNSKLDVFVRDRVAGTSRRVSISSSGEQGNGHSGGPPSISGDGRFVVFTSQATNLVSGDTNGITDVFAHDLVTGTTTRVSVDSSGNQSNDISSLPRISGDGRYVVFQSDASNLVPEDTNGGVFGQDIFLHDRVTAETSRMSVGPSGQQCDCDSSDPSISSDGQFVAFRSDGLTPGESHVGFAIYVRQVSPYDIEIVSNGPEDTPANGNTGELSWISADGRYVAFASWATNLVPNDTNELEDIFLHDRLTRSAKRVNLSSSGAQANNYDFGAVRRISVSAHGRFIAFASDATNLVPFDTNMQRDIFVRDVVAGTTTRVSVDNSGNQSSSASERPAISSNGRYVVFDSRMLSGGSLQVHIRDQGPLLSIPDAQTFGPCQSATHAANPTDCQSDPVNSATGSFVTSATDIALPGIGIPFVFSRSYTSADTSPGPLGIGWTHNYGVSLTIQPNGDAIFRAETGQQIPFTLQADGSFLPPSGGRSTLRAVQGGYELLTRDQIRYRFDTQGRVTSLKERNNQGLTFSYDADGRLNVITDSVGRAISLTYNPSGLLSGVSVPDGRSVAYGYTSGRLSSVTDVRGGTSSYTYDANGWLEAVVDANSHTVVTNTYGSGGRVIRQVDALGNPSTFSWDSATQTQTMTDARGNTWQDVYSGNVLIRRIDPLGNTITFDYDDDLNLMSITDPRGNTTLLAYGQAGNLISRTAPRPLAYKETFKYDAQNNLVSRRDGRGNTTRYDYDAAGNLIRVTEPGNVVTEYGRHPDGTGQLVSITDPRLKVTRFDYDTSGNLTTITSPLGNVIRICYDSAGRMTSLVEPRGITCANPDDYRWVYTYDAAGNMLTETDPLGNRTTWGYDSAGNLTSRIDAKDRTTSWAYNAANELTSVTAPGNIITSYDYDAVGNLRTRTDAKTHVTTYGYDQANRLSSVTLPLNRQWTYDYDASGNLTTTIDAAGSATPQTGDGTTTYSYDALNRLTGIDYSDATPDVTFGYDANSNPTSMTDGAGTETYTFDDLDRLTRVTRGSQTFSYEYDAAGNVTKRTYPDSTVVDYSYDDDGRLLNITSGGATTTHGYDVAGNLTQITLPSANGYGETRTYDRAGRLTEVKNAKGTDVLSRFTYTLDAVGNPTQVVTPTETITYQYDNMDRLTEVCYQASCPGANDPFIRHSYDNVGNRSTETRPAGITTYSYNDADQLTSRSGPSGTTSYSYDPNGNQTAAGNTTFTYDLANRMKSATTGPTTITYTYDGAGKRLQASSGSQASKKTNYLSDVNGILSQLALERDGSDRLLRRYVHGHDLVSMSTGGAPYYYHHDGLGSIANLTSDKGVLQWTYSYEPFGVVRSEIKNNRNAPTNLMRFAGELLDTTTGLYHLRAREYDATTGRLLRIDPLPAPISAPYTGRYVYVGNRPTVLVDPSGLRGVDKSGCPYWGRLLTFGEWENVYCEGFQSMSPGWQAALGGNWNFSACWYGCITVGAEGISIGFFQFGPGKTRIRQGFGFAAYATIGSEPESGLSAMVCNGVCLGGYGNVGAPGGGAQVGIGTPGVFLGGNIEP
ncbi:MAG: DUF6531 domain-containing protein [Actinomycetota bacterium]